ncbi:hypothetical protein LZ198_07830 [Myxococcus sp. K15C18031901]|uniref:hypothetical protein n=1 Tax=Myxococcus dinghuensis TaxID=2906761 RepID=UPI0020A70684|nr:hypothetical protein [Myxococcus dinghuensis]MCP3098782.1 hypothetical protein [Myxococcus dinghuensis]
MRTKMLVFLALVLVSGVVASYFSHALWGYAITPPSGAGVIASAHQLEALTRFAIDTQGNVELRAVEPIEPGEFVACPLFDFDARCLSSRLLAAVLTLPGDASRTESLESLRPQIERACSLWPMRRGGMAITVQGDSGQERLVTCSSGEVSNDHYAYREVLFSGGEEREVVSIEYEIAGFEFLTMPFLFIVMMIVNSGLFGCGWVVWKLRQILAEPMVEEPGSRIVS